MSNHKTVNFDTLCVHAGVQPEPITGAIMTPIFQTSTYVQEEPGHAKIYDYSRAGNPTRTALEVALAALENGSHAVSFSSGLAAVQAAVQLLNSGDHVILCDDVYGGTARLFRKIFSRYNIDYTLVDMTEVASIAKSITSKTRMIWIETPTNPLLKVIDIQAVCELAKKHNCISVVDNTFASPVFQQPLALGADIVMHSTTKYIGGHSDLIGGALITSNKQLFDELKFIQFAAGGVNSPFEAFLLLRSIKTLNIRMHKHHTNSLFLATEFVKQNLFAEVLYPGLESHPSYSVARKQMSGFSGMISIRLKGDFDDVKTFLSHLKIFSLAESLGGVESLVNHPETMTHASVPVDHRKKIGITSDLIRLSVGIENPEDLLNDIKTALSFVAHK